MADVGRGRRSAASRADKARSLIAEAQRKRKLGEQVQEEARVYDVVDDEAYAKLVAKRREQGGFIEDDNGVYGEDLGEEEDWDAPEEEEEEAPTEEDGKPKKKQKGEKKSKEKPQPDPAAKARMQKMFASAAARSRPTAQAAATDQSSDALLNELLAGLDSGSSVPAAAPLATPARSRPSAATFTPRTGASSAAAATASPRGVATPRTVGSAAPRRPSTLSRVKRLPLSRSPSPPPDDGYDDDLAMPDAYESDGEQQQPAAQQPRRSEVAAAVKQEPESGSKEAEEEELLRATMEAEAAEASQAATAAHVATPAAAPRVKQETEAATPSGATVTGTPYQPRAPGSSLAAVTPAAPPKPSGWDDVYEADGPECSPDKKAVIANSEERRTLGQDGGINCCIAGDAKPEVQWEEAAGQLDKLRDDGNKMQLEAYFMDAHEEMGQPGKVYLFCKVQVEWHWLSTCVAVPVPHRTIYAVPHPKVLEAHSERLQQLEAEAEEAGFKGLNIVDHLPLKIFLQQTVLAEVKEELRDTLGSLGVMDHGRVVMRPARRNYAFERTEIRHGLQWVLQVEVPAAAPTLPPDLKGELFVAMLGGSQSSMEALLLERNIMGPGFIKLVNAERIQPNQQVSWCKLEVAVGDHHDVSVIPPSGQAPPPLTVAALNLKTWLNPANGNSEVVAASVVYIPALRQDVPFPKEQWKRKLGFKHFSIVRKLDGHPFPAGFEANVQAANRSPAGRRNGGNMLAAQPSEKALLTNLVNRLASLDADAFVGHNISAFDLDILLNRLEHHKVFQWSRVGRLKRQKFPSLKGGGHTFGGGAGAGALAAIAGRLLVDTYLAAREFTRAVEYTLASLSANMLQEHREEVTSSDVAGRFESAAGLEGLVRAAEADAWLALGLASVLNVVPLSAQLANVSGALWSRVLQGQRAHRIEMLLAHEFHGRGFLLPDRLSMRDKERMARAAGELDDADDAPTTGKRKAAYAGGLVLEPKKGLYDDFTLLLDFNSLYPSIIREFNICFTTVARAAEGASPELPTPGQPAAPLPQIVERILDRRKRVKKLMDSERDELRKQQHNTRQLALKLTANSMYGCLGFRASRFFAQPLAELITAAGRDILQATVDLVQTNFGLEVIYGDTDSIMVNSRKKDIAECEQLARKIMSEVNKRYKMLELGYDGLFKVILLLKKKKYAAIKFERGPDGWREVREEKGLDQVRRDWCPLSKDVGRFALSHILSGRPAEEVVTAIHDHLRQVKEKVDAGEVPLHKFLITKQLTKRPEDYPDAKNQPHVQVALRRRAAGLRNGVMQGETVPYIICINKAEGGEAAASGKGLAARAFHLDEVRASDSQLEVDASYYLSQQVHPVVARLCAPIEGTDAARLADCLGLDPSRFAGSGGGGATSSDAREDALVSGAAFFDDPARFQDCEALELATESGAAFKFCGVEPLLRGTVDAAAALQPPDAVGAPASEGLGPLTGAQLANQAVLSARAAVSRYYDAELRSDDELAPQTMRDICLGAGADGRPGTAPADASASGTMGRVFGEAALYTQLSALYRSLDVKSALARMPKSDEVSTAERRVEPVRRQLDAAAAAVDTLRRDSAYRWVSLKDICC